MARKTRNPIWNEEFQFLLEEPPLQDKIHIKVMSKRTSLSFHSKVRHRSHPFRRILFLSILALEVVRLDFNLRGFIVSTQESLGHVDINLADVVHNGRINQKYHLIDSKNGVIHVELRWKTI